MPELQEKPWLRMHITCETCGLAVDAPLIIEPTSPPHLETFPLKIVTATNMGELLHWAILCTECVPAYLAQLRTQHPDHTMQMTSIQARDADRLRALVKEG